jgi:hypothetical protein
MAGPLLALLVDVLLEQGEPPLLQPCALLADPRTGAVSRGSSRRGR